MSSSDSEDGNPLSPRPFSTRSPKLEELFKIVAIPGSEKLTYTEEDLAALGISLFFSKFPCFADEMKFFQPISAADLARYNAPEDRFEEDYEYLLEEYRETDRLCTCIESTLDYRYRSLRRGKKGRYLEEIYKWTPITIENSFYRHRGEYFLRALGSPAGWELTSLEEWIQPGGDEIPEPHVRMITINYGVPDNTRLLVSELSAIVQVLDKRVNQPELQEASLFPVLLISLSGLGNGRIIEALYDVEQDELTLRASEIISLAKNPALDLILRFMASKPQV